MVGSVEIHRLVGIGADVVELPGVFFRREGRPDELPIVLHHGAEPARDVVAPAALHVREEIGVTALGEDGP